MGKTGDSMKECSECKSTFIRHLDIIRHIKRFHPNKAEKLISLLENKDPPFKCDYCKKGFHHKKNLTFHLKTHETGIGSSGVIIRKKCPLCDHVATFKKDFYDHCLDTHNIELDVEKIDFPSLDGFENWKSEIERAMDSKFVKEYGSTPRMTNYVCHQSEYSLSENGIENEKNHPKVNGFCPAGFRVMHESNNTYSIYFVKTHICHQNKNLVFPNIPKESDNTKKTGKKSQAPNVNDEVNNHHNDNSHISEDTNSDQIEPAKRTLKKKSESKLTSQKQKTFFNRKKEMIKNTLTTLNSISNFVELEAVQELINPIKPILEILKRKHGSTSFPKGEPGDVVMNE